MVNKVMLLGYLGRDPELRYTPQGKAVATMRIATERRWKDEGGTEQKETEWHTVIAWNGLAESCHAYLQKGRLVAIEGRLQTTRWEEHGVKQRRTVVIAEDVRFIPTSRMTTRKPSEDEDLPV